LTTPLYYVNGEPHVGHIYTTVIADAIARFRRLTGMSVCALTGTDEHGLKIERTAREQGVPPKELTDRYSATFSEAWQRLGLHFDEFIRTTQPRHAVAVGEIYRRIEENGHIYLGEYSGDYCVSCEAYAPEGEKTCPDCGRPTEFMTEKSYFFRLSAFGDRLLQFYDSNPDFVLPQPRMNEIVSFVRGGLRDLSISRTSFHWGIPVPGDPRHIFYVWFDALTGYLSGIGFGSDEEAFRNRWPADVQLIGKDILRFHAVYWPAFLMAAGLEPPRHLLVNGWWTVNGEKMSKSRGNFISWDELADRLPSDYVRYFLLREIALGGDGDFSYASLVSRVNSDLANDVGNLANRTLKMIESYFEGVIPERLDDRPAEQALAEQCRETARLFRESFERYQIARALDAVSSLVSAANKYIVVNEPWVLAKDPAKRNTLSSVLYHAAEAVRVIALLFSPVVPEGSVRILSQLGVETPEGGFGWEDLGFGRLVPGTRTSKVEAVFPRLDLEEVVKTESTEPVNVEPQASQPQAGPETKAPVVAEPAAAVADDSRIGIEDFAKVEMRTARIIQAERVPKSKKLIRLIVDLGFEQRQVVAGIGEAYSPETLVGRMAVVVTNLKPAKLMGVESNGMIVAASEDGKPVLATFAEEVGLGVRLK